MIFFPNTKENISNKRYYVSIDTMSTKGEDTAETVLLLCQYLFCKSNKSLPLFSHIDTVGTRSSREVYKAIKIHIKTYENKKKSHC